MNYLKLIGRKAVATRASKIELAFQLPKIHIIRNIIIYILLG